MTNEHSYMQKELEIGLKGDKPNPIENLVGYVTNDGWRVLRRIEKSRNQTGGCFSIGYVVEQSDGRRGFLKALDFQSAQLEQDPPRALEKMLATFNFERDLLELCNNKKMSRIVRALTNGAFSVPSAPLDQVYYLIFELADGDTRTQVSRKNMRDYAWAAKMCHQVAVGMRQLHQLGITHQDLKPSNVLVFDSGAESKLADLGRAHYTGLESPHDEFQIPGATLYAAPELLYGHEATDKLWGRRSADLYLLGSMLMYGFSGTAMTPSLIANLREEHRPFILAHVDGWRGYFLDVVPYLLEAWSVAVEQLEGQLLADIPATSHKAVHDIIEVVKTLTNPDPQLRGTTQAGPNPMQRSLDLESTVSVLARVAATLKYAKLNS